MGIYGRSFLMRFTKPAHPCSLVPQLMGLCMLRVACHRDEFCNTWGSSSVEAQGNSYTDPCRQAVITASLMHQSHHNTVDIGPTNTSSNRTPLLGAQRGRLPTRLIV
mmetsp:Transcript_15536/g.35561  ORF Transcript_15536/g.35561 Transcript_15536/m.35561 type:complete len:107 (+) Transcript_15536:895-1215(+)